MRSWGSAVPSAGRTFTSCCRIKDLNDSGTGSTEGYMAYCRYRGRLATMQTDAKVLQLQSGGCRLKSRFDA
jgi:hypothetical protein